MASIPPENFPASGSNPLDRLEIVFEDPWLLVVNKPCGVAVHGDPPKSSGPSVFAHDDLQKHLEKSRGESLTLFHRLDRDTSGLVILGRHPEIRFAMNELFEKKRIRKAYTAVVRGRWFPQWNRVENFLGQDVTGRRFNRSGPPGQAALTTFRLLAAKDGQSWIEAIPKTGRTHQIRLHCLERGCPILGDSLYGGTDDMVADTLGHELKGSLGEKPNSQLDAGRDLKRVITLESPIRLHHAQALHAYRVDFRHPKTGAALSLRAAPPLEWPSVWLEGLGSPEDWRRPEGRLARIWSQLFARDF